MHVKRSSQRCGTSQATGLWSIDLWTRALFPDHRTSKVRRKRLRDIAIHTPSRSQSCRSRPFENGLRPRRAQGTRARGGVPWPRAGKRSSCVGLRPLRDAPSSKDPDVTRSARQSTPHSNRWVRPQEGLRAECHVQAWTDVRAGLRGREDSGRACRECSRGTSGHVNRESLCSFFPSRRVGVGDA